MKYAVCIKNHTTNFFHFVRTGTHYEVIGDEIRNRNGSIICQIESPIQMENYEIRELLGVKIGKEIRIGGISHQASTYEEIVGQVATLELLNWQGDFLVKVKGKDFYINPKDVLPL